jgi:hypothetical protein
MQIMNDGSKKIASSSCAFVRGQISAVSKNDFSFNKSISLAFPEQYYETVICNYSLFEYYAAANSPDIQLKSKKAWVPCV